MADLEPAMIIHQEQRPAVFESDQIANQHIARKDLKSRDRGSRNMRHKTHRSIMGDDKVPPAHMTFAQQRQSVTPKSSEGHRSKALYKTPFVAKGGFNSRRTSKTRQSPNRGGGKRTSFDARPGGIQE